MPEPVIFQKSPIVQKVEPGVYWWCACGRSKSQPFCDGSHKGTGLEPKEVVIEAAKTVGCKPVLVKTGRGKLTLEKFSEDDDILVYENLLDFVNRLS